MRLPTPAGTGSRYKSPHERLQPPPPSTLTANVAKRTSHAAATLQQARPQTPAASFIPYAKTATPTNTTSATTRSPLDAAPPNHPLPSQPEAAAPPPVGRSSLSPTSTLLGADNEMSPAFQNLEEFARPDVKRRKHHMFLRDSFPGAVEQSDASDERDDDKFKPLPISTHASAAASAFASAPAAGLPLSAAQWAPPCHSRREYTCSRARRAGRTQRRFRA